MAIKISGIIPFSFVDNHANGYGLQALAIISSFRSGQMLCFGAKNNCAANKHTGVLIPGVVA